MTFSDILMNDNIDNTRLWWKETVKISGLWRRLTSRTKILFCLILDIRGMIYYSLLLLLICAPQTFYAFAEESKGQKGQELLLCRKCGSDVADSYYLFTKNSPGAHKTEKQNLFGRQNITVQTLINPFGINFDIVTAEKVRCQNLGQPQGADSWFPGYVWRICACPQCGHHLGWTFESVMDKGVTKEKDHIHQFHGLILSNVLGENFTDSLIMMPKTYKM